MMVWEDMTAGSLAYLLPDPSSYPPFSNQSAWKVLAAQNFQRFSLPESLCWHVLKAISRALLWLHFGIKESDGRIGEWEECDEDWQTVLIMDVRSGQIWFKKPRGEETYGECKLGGFKSARVMQGKGGGVSEKQLYWSPVSLFPLCDEIEREREREGSMLI
jgi:hypothetical protein